MERRRFLGALAATSLGVALKGSFTDARERQYLHKLSPECLGTPPRWANFPRTQQ